MIKFKSLFGLEERTVRRGWLFLPVRFRHLTLRPAGWLLYHREDKDVLKLGRTAVIDRLSKGSRCLSPDTQCHRGRVRFSLLGCVKLPPMFCGDKSRFQVMVIGMGTHLEVQSLETYQQTAAQWITKMKTFHKSYID